MKVECRKCCSRFGFYQIVELPVDDLFENITFPEEVIKDTMRDYEIDRDEAESMLRDVLLYWRTYYKPEIEDVNIAMKTRLVPFYYNEEFYLALGGCGMDLTPCLDAYQVLTQGTIDPYSTLFSDPKYFRWVVGSEVFKEVLGRLAIDEQNLLG